MNGWVKIHRNLFEWQWYGNPEMVALWVHLILSANHADGEWRGVPVKRGQVVTSRKELARKIGLSERVVRTCLHRLQMTNDVTIKATNKYSIITICEYDIYQTLAPISDQQTDQQTTTNKNIRSKEYNTSTSARARLEESTINNSLWLDKTAMDMRTTDVVNIAMEVMNGWEISQIPDEEWTAYHLVCSMRKLISIRKIQARPTKLEEKEERRAKLKMSILNDLKSMQNGYSTEQKN